MLAAITRLVHDLGVTVVLAEHRLERVVQYADRVIEVRPTGRCRTGPPASMLRTTQVAPPVVELGRLAGWDPLPLSVRDARRLAAPLRDRIGDRPGSAQRRSDPRRRVAGTVLRARNIVVRYGAVIAVRGVDVDLGGGEVTALMGRNGSGKSSLLWAIQGSGPRQSGTVDIDGVGSRNRCRPAKARAIVGLVPQTPADLLYLDTVAQECDQADRESDGASPLQRPGHCSTGWPRASRLTMHPRDLSEGQRLSLVLAVQLTAAPKVVLLDEPTRGLDYPAKRSLVGIIDQLAGEGRSVVVSTHDVEFVAAVADRVVVMAAGEVVADGPAPEVMVASPSFAPQVAKILAPLEFLTMDQVADALRRPADGQDWRAIRHRPAVAGDHRHGLVHRVRGLPLAVRGGPGQVRGRRHGAAAVRRPPGSGAGHGVRRDGRRRHRCQGHRHAGRPLGHRSRPAPVGGGNRRHRDGVLHSW